MKSQHEFRDPIHGFITMQTVERAVVDSWPFQRLRDIHQLAMTYLVYPGATHRRFEHSLGVMELASRVFDTITLESNARNIPSGVRDAIPQIEDKEGLPRWKRTLRMAALCHDLGHMPFSHASEDLLPGSSHECMTWSIIHSCEMTPLWDELRLEPKEIAKLALGPKEVAELHFDEDVTFSTWESLLSEIIVGDAFGVDRMDYLLRDSHHLGVSYGRFDLQRILQGLRIAAKAPDGPEEGDQSLEPVIGVEHGALHAAAALLWARYSIFSQVYFHHVRRIYDIHLQDFMRACFPKGYPVKVKKFLEISDSAVLQKLYAAAMDGSKAGHEDAARLTQRKHFRRIYQQSKADVQIGLQKGIFEPGQILYERLSQEFGKENVKYDAGSKKHKRVDFPVVSEDAQKFLLASQEMPTINSVPDVESRYIFVRPDIVSKARSFLEKERQEILS